MSNAPHKVLRRTFWLAFSVALLLSVIPQTRAQGSSPAREQDGAGAQPEGVSEEKVNPMRLLNLTPDQVRQVREIRILSEPEGRALLRRMNMARRSLDAALYANDSDEALIQQRAGELAAAQAAVTRMRAQVEWKIRSVLTPAQLNALRELRARARQQRLEERRDLRNQPPQPRNALDRRPNANDDKPANQRIPLRRLRRRGLLQRQP